MVQRRPATAAQIAAHVVPLIAGNLTGLTVAGLVASLFAPLVRHDRKFLLLWCSTTFAYVAVSAISGSTIRPRFLLSYDVLAFTLGCIAALSLVERNGLSRIIGILLAIAILACASIGAVEVVRQAMTTRMSARCAGVIEAIADPKQSKILTGLPLGVSVSVAAEDEDYARVDRLAKKYGVKSMDRAKERLSRRDRRNPVYFVRGIPFSHDGSEDLPTEEVEKLVKPAIGFWPLQDEEWNLDYWTAQGFDIFVVRSEQDYLNAKNPLYRSLHQQIKDRCELVAVLPTTRPLFFEQEVKIYKLRDQPGRDDQHSPRASCEAGPHDILAGTTTPSLGHLLRPQIAHARGTRHASGYGAVRYIRSPRVCLRPPVTNSFRRPAASSPARHK